MFPLPVLFRTSLSSTLRTQNLSLQRSQGHGEKRPAHPRLHNLRESFGQTQSHCGQTKCHPSVRPSFGLGRRLSHLHHKGAQHQIVVVVATARPTRTEQSSPYARRLGRRLSEARSTQSRSQSAQTRSLAVILVFLGVEQRSFDAPSRRCGVPSQVEQ